MYKMTSRGQKEDDGKRREEEEKKNGGKEEKRKRKRGEGKRVADRLEEDMNKKKRIGPSARELEDEGPRAGPSTTTTPRSNTRLSISGFKFHRVLGKGSFGKVVFASVRGQNIYKAIKVIRKRNNAKDLKRERRVLLAARDCPFLCHLHAALQSQRYAYFIMEYLSGGSLWSLIKMCGRLNTETIRFYTAELICGLQFLHGHGIAHRDLKPGNIMLDKDGHIRIIDLGLACDGLTESSKIHGRAGTFRYMAPEMLLNKAYTVAVDWWSLGIVVSKMSFGHSPFNDDPQDRKVYHESVTTEEPTLPPWLNEDLKHLIQELLQKDPEWRLVVSGNIRDHPFFGTICWEELEMRRAQPPFTPFPSRSRVNHPSRPEDEPALDPVSSFSFISPSWPR